jgi:hypothetical protein
MGVLQNFTIDQLAGSIALILGSLGGLLLIIWKSRCKKINCCYICRCEREVQDEDNEDGKRQNKGAEKDTALELIKKDELNKKLNDKILHDEELKRLALTRDTPNITPRQETI